MLSLIPIAALITLGAPPLDPVGERNAAIVAPFLGSEVAALVRVDLNRINVETIVRAVGGNQADDDRVKGAVQSTKAWVDALKRGGARDIYVLVDLTDFPGLPLVVIPFADGADAKAIATALTEGAPVPSFRWPKAETMRGAVVAGTADAVAQVRTLQPAPRSDLAAALSVGANASVQIVLMPSEIQRRALEESMTALPADFGGVPITTVTRGFKWGSIAVVVDPKPMLRATLQAKDEQAAQGLEKIVASALNVLAQKAGEDPRLAAFVNALQPLKPQLAGDRVTLETDPKQTAELVLVPVHQAREKAVRSQCMNNLRQIGLAMHNYHSDHNTFPAAFSTSKDGKPLLSWRVHLLPFLGQMALYQKFHLDEPWDSEHNRALISQMPVTYACPGANQAAIREGKTTYLTPRGPQTIFPGAQPVKVQEITDGTVNTIMVVDAGDSLAVTWTKPDDWDIGAEPTGKGLFGHHPQGTNVCFADGSGRFLKETIKPKTLRELLTRNGGEVVDPSED